MAADEQPDLMADPEFKRKLAELREKSSPRINWKKVKKGVYRFQTHEEADEWWRQFEEPADSPKSENV